MGCFPMVQFGIKIVVGYYCGKLLTANLYGDKDLDRRYWAGLMSVSVKELQTHAIQINDDGKDIDGSTYYVWIASAVCSPLRFIIDPRTLKGDRTAYFQDPHRRQISV